MMAILMDLVRDKTLKKSIYNWKSFVDFLQEMRKIKFWHMHLKIDTFLKDFFPLSFFWGKWTSYHSLKVRAELKCALFIFFLFIPYCTSSALTFYIFSFDCLCFLLRVKFNKSIRRDIKKKVGLTLLSCCFQVKVEFPRLWCWKVWFRGWLWKQSSLWSDEPGRRHGAAAGGHLQSRWRAVVWVVHFLSNHVAGKRI